MAFFTLMCSVAGLVVRVRAALSFQLGVDLGGHNAISEEGDDRQSQHVKHHDNAPLVTLFEEGIKRQQHVPIMPGTVVRMHEGPDDVEPGFFVFLGEQKSEMILARAGENEDGDVVPTSEVHRVSVDWREGVEGTGMRVPLQSP